MELQEGGNLDKAIHPKANDANARNFSLVERLGMLAKMAKAIADFHEAGFVHSDLKPENIFLSDRRATRIRLGDFGQSVETRALNAGQSTYQMTLTQRGTPLYSAPEMLHVPSCADLLLSEEARVASTSRKTDVYAFGVICWEVLCRERRKPYYDKKFSPRDIKEEGLRPSLDDLFVGVPNKIKDLISKCFSKNRNRRPTDRLGMLHRSRPLL